MLFALASAMRLASNGDVRPPLAPHCEAAVAVLPSSGGAGFNSTSRNAAFRRSRKSRAS